MKLRHLTYLPIVLALLSCSFLTVGMDSNLGGDSGVAVGEPVASQINLDDPDRYPAFVGIPLDADSFASTGRLVIPASDIAPGVVRGVLEDDTPYIGNPDAPIMLAEYADFACPHCAEYAPEAERIITELVRTGQAVYTFNILTFVGRDYSQEAGEAALCAGEQGAFWEYRSELFVMQSQEGYQDFNVERLTEKATELGLNSETFRACLEGDTQNRVIQRMKLRSDRLMIASVPTLIYSTDKGDTWQFFTDSDGNRTTRGSFEDVKALVESVQP